MGKKLPSAVLTTGILKDAPGRWPFRGTIKLPLGRACRPVLGTMQSELSLLSKTELRGEYQARTLDI